MFASVLVCLLGLISVVWEKLLLVLEVAVWELAVVEKLDLACFLQRG